jgi:subfamily B ATP-binding cassette protein MsbA
MSSPRELNLGRFLRPHMATMAIVVAVTVVLSVLAMLPPLLIRAVIDRVVGDGRTDIFPLLAIAMLAVPVLASFGQYLQTLGVAYLGQRLVFDIRVTLYRHLLGMSLRFFGKHSAGKLVNRLMGDSGVVQRMLTAQSISIVSDLVCATFAISATFIINWRMAVLLLMVVAGFVVNYRLNARRIIKASRDYRSSMDRMSGGIHNRLLANVTVKVFGMESSEQAAFRSESGASMNLATEAMIASTRLSMNSQLLQQMGQVSLYFIGCAFVLGDKMSYGDVIAFTTYAVQLLWPAVRFSEIIRMLQEVRISVGRIHEIMREEPEIQSQPGAVKTKRIHGDVAFEHVNFHYTPGAPVIRDFSLRVKAGQTVALIGPTGCGKSTILNLVMRFYDVCDGRLTIDGVDIRNLELNSLRHQFGIVLQEPLLFDVSIAENIRYGRPSASPADIEAAARAAEIHDYIVSLPEQYRTIVGSEGVEMSLGQKQRLTIARAIAADPAILIMDEATSSLDSESEAAIQRAMGRILRGRTCFVVAHRLSTIRNADIIVLLKDGVVAELGDHQRLMAIPGGHYRALYEQFMGRNTIDPDKM